MFYFLGGRCSSETSQQLKIIIQQIYKCKYLCCCKSQDSTSKFFIYVQLFSSKENWEFQNSYKISEIRSAMNERLIFIIWHKNIEYTSILWLQCYFFLFHSKKRPSTRKVKSTTNYKTHSNSWKRLAIP